MMTTWMRAFRRIAKSWVNVFSIAMMILLVKGAVLHYLKMNTLSVHVRFSGNIKTIQHFFRRIVRWVVHVILTLVNCPTKKQF